MGLEGRFNTKGWLCGLAGLTLMAGPAAVEASVEATTPASSVEAVELIGQVSVNGTAVSVSTTGSYDLLSTSYQFPGAAPSGSGLSDRDKLLLTLIPRAALAFLPVPGRPDLLGASGASGLSINLTGRRKVDEVSSITASLHVSRSAGKVRVDFNGAITAPPDRPVEADGEAVVRIGVNPSAGVLHGFARLNYDLAQPDPASLGTADFWNLSGTVAGAQDLATRSWAHVDHAGGNLATGLAQGAILSFPSSTVPASGIITLSGEAQRDGVIHQFLGYANQAGGGETTLTFPVAIQQGMRAHQVAERIAYAFNEARKNKVTPNSQYILAVQGGDGVSITTPDPTSPRVAVSLTLDDGQTIADPDSAEAAAVFITSSTQNFSDQAVVASQVTGIRNQFGLLGQEPMTGWLTPFKVVFTTDNPATGYGAAGGGVSILLNWSENVPGGSLSGLPGSQTSFPDLTVPTVAGESAEQVVRKVTAALRGQVTAWGSVPFSQRQGNVLYIDAGIDFPHSVSLASSDAGVGYMSAAADLPNYPGPGSS
jgi:hypothetical protein